MKKIFFTILAFGMVMGLSAQKYGYLNSSQLLVQLPEVKQADDQLVQYQKSLISEGEKMVKTFETSYQAYMKEAEGGTLSKIQMQQKEGALGQKQQEIQAYEVEVQQKLVMKREELYKPILDKLKTTLDKIGADNGYTMIFDTSAGGILHANDGDDVMPIIKAKLGL